MHRQRRRSFASDPRLASPESDSVQFGMEPPPRWCNVPEIRVIAELLDTIKDAIRRARKRDAFALEEAEAALNRLSKVLTTKSGTIPPPQRQPSIRRSWRQAV